MSNNLPTLSFGCDFDESTAWEVQCKGWFELAIVHLPDGRKLPLSFWDPVRLAQELESDLKIGKSCLAEPAMIVIPEVTVQNMRAAAVELFQRGFFEHFRSVN